MMPPERPRKRPRIKLYCGTTSPILSMANRGPAELTTPAGSGSFQEPCDRTDCSPSSRPPPSSPPGSCRPAGPHRNARLPGQPHGRRPAPSRRDAVSLLRRTLSIQVQPVQRGPLCSAGGASRVRGQGGLVRPGLRGHRLSRGRLVPSGRPAGRAGDAGGSPRRPHPGQVPFPRAGARSDQRPGGGPFRRRAPASLFPPDLPDNAAAKPPPAPWAAWPRL